MHLQHFNYLIAFAIIHSVYSAAVLTQIAPKKEFQQYGLALDAIFGMGIRLQVLLDSSTRENFVVSPVSTTAVIGQLMLGAEGEFRDQLYDLLSLPKVESNSYITHYGKDKGNKSYSLPYAAFHLQLSSLLKALQKRETGEQFVLNQNNALFYNRNIELKKQFTSSLSNMYNAEITPLDFYTDTTSTINNWASMHTNGLINSVISHQPSPTTSSIFLNAIYFKAEWETKFSDELNVLDKFYTDENSTVETTYMRGILEEIPYVQAKDYRLVCLPYKNRELGMYIIFPNEDNPYKYDMKKFAQNINHQEILDGISNFKQRDVVVKIPKLSLSNTLRILDPLTKYAEFRKMKLEEESNNTNAWDEIKEDINAFRNFTSSTQAKSDILLSGAAENIHLRVSDIVQQLVFSINEKGTEAAAVTSSITDYMGGSKTLVLNRPFSFFIRHEATLATIFWGTISNPSHN